MQADPDENGDVDAVFDSYLIWFLSLFARHLFPPSWVCREGAEEPKRWPAHLAHQPVGNQGLALYPKGQFTTVRLS